MATARIKVMVVFGTRPEAIKMAPVIHELRATPHRFDTRVCVTGQHREMLDQVLALFAITPDFDLNVMRPNQSLSGLAAAVLARLDPLLDAEQPDWVLAQGDTTTVMAAAIAAFHRRIKIGHVEAGLRTHDKWQPFPEEINRKVATAIADLHFAPTAGARDNLLAEGVRPETVLVTGNTVIDALRMAAAMPFDTGAPPLSNLPADKKIILVTAHRRENFGAPLLEICGGLRALALRRPDAHLIYPVHLNPNVQGPVRKALGGLPNVTLSAPLEYLPLVNVMKRAYFVITDSGGIQEEAPGLGKPVLVLRDNTERPEAVAAGTVKLIGAHARRIVDESERLLDDPAAYSAMARAVNPYGDGAAAGRIAGALLVKGR